MVMEGVTRVIFLIVLFGPGLCFTADVCVCECGGYASQSVYRGQRSWPNGSSDGPAGVIQFILHINLHKYMYVYKIYISSLCPPEVAIG